ncbi:hypothetical protein V8F33_006898 [Rhypophila sp. PSN 637]
MAKIGGQFAKKRYYCPANSYCSDHILCLCTEKGAFDSFYGICDVGGGVNQCVPAINHEACGCAPYTVACNFDEICDFDQLGNAECKKCPDGKQECGSECVSMKKRDLDGRQDPDRSLSPFSPAVPMRLPNNCRTTRVYPGALCSSRTRLVGAESGPRGRPSWHSKGKAESSSSASPIQPTIELGPEEAYATTLTGAAPDVYTNKELPRGGCFHVWNSAGPAS